MGAPELHTNLAPHLVSDMNSTGCVGVPEVLTHIITVADTSGVTHEAALEYVPEATWMVVPEAPKVKLEAALVSVAQGAA